ncbi:hypothetical protein JMJ77_0013654, partial [Colletotrichum scovillei]
KIQVKPRADGTNTPLTTQPRDPYRKKAISRFPQVFLFQRDLSTPHSTKSEAGDRFMIRGFPLVLWWPFVPTDHHDIGLAPFGCLYLLSPRNETSRHMSPVHVDHFLRTVDYTKYALI